MKNRTGACAGSVVVLGLAAASACIGFRGPEDLRRDIVQTTGVELQREVGVTVGRAGVALVRWFTPEDEIPLKGVRRVQVGVYRVSDAARGDPAADLLEIPALADWEPVVRLRERDENVLVMLRQENDAIRGLLVVVMEGDEWVLVRVRGKLQHVVEEAMQLAFDRTDRPDLYGPAVAEYRESRPAEVAEIRRSGGRVSE
jgi:hypothetical protein